MDESLQDLELELTALTLRSLRPQLLEQVGKEMVSPLAETGPAPRAITTLPARRAQWHWLASGLAGVAAAVAVLVTVLHFSTHDVPDDQAKGAPIAADASAPTSDDHYRPVAAANVLYEMKDEGPVTAAGDVAERRVRYRYVDTYTWKNPKNNASLTWSVPRDEIRLQPAQFN